MKVSHSRVDCFNTCPYQYKLRYIDKLKTFFNCEADNALVIGTALHRGIETDVDTAIAEYFANYPIASDKNIEEAIKLEYVIKKCKELLPNGLHEVKIECAEFIGFIDLLVEVEEGVYDLYDFKYSNNIDRYLESGQLHEYKFYFERSTNKQIRDMYFLFAPKVSIRLKKTETLEEFRRRLKSELESKSPKLIKVDYDIEKVKDFLRKAKSCLQATVFPKKQSRLCDWCEYKGYCLEDNDLDIDWLETEKEKTK